MLLILGFVLIGNHSTRACSNVFIKYHLSFLYLLVGPIKKKS